MVSLVAFFLVGVGFGLTLADCLTLVDLVDLVFLVPPPPDLVGDRVADGGLIIVSSEWLAHGDIAGIVHLRLRKKRGGVGLAPSHVGRDRVEGGGGRARERRIDRARIGGATRFRGAEELVLHCPPDPVLLNLVGILNPRVN